MARLPRWADIRYLNDHVIPLTQDASWHLVPMPISRKRTAALFEIFFL
jgi:hypothetical protein